MGQKRGRWDLPLSLLLSLQPSRTSTPPTIRFPFAPCGRAHPPRRHTPRPHARTHTHEYARTHACVARPARADRARAAAAARRAPRHPCAARAPPRQQHRRHHPHPSLRDPPKCRPVSRRRSGRLCCFSPHDRGRRRRHARRGRRGRLDPGLPAPARGRTARGHRGASQWGWWEWWRPPPPSLCRPSSPSRAARRPPRLRATPPTPPLPPWRQRVGMACWQPLAPMLLRPWGRLWLLAPRQRAPPRASLTRWTCCWSRRPVPAGVGRPWWRWW